MCITKEIQTYWLKKNSRYFSQVSELAGPIRLISVGLLVCLQSTGESDGDWLIKKDLSCDHSVLHIIPYASAGCPTCPWQWQSLEAGGRIKVHKRRRLRVSTITSASFCWPKQVIRPARLKGWGNGLHPWWENQRGVDMGHTHIHTYIHSYIHRSKVLGWFLQLINHKCICNYDSRKG